MKNYVVIAKMMIVFIAIVIITLCSFYRYEIRPISEDTADVTITVNEGDTWYNVGTYLYEQNLLRSYKFYKVYIKLFKPKNLEAGIYILNEGMSLPEIIDTLEKGASKDINEINITFKEGINMRQIADIIASNTSNSTDDIYTLLEDEEYIDELINNYWFLTDEIKNSDIYYPLEGYLFPNTYSINKNSDVGTIFKVMLDQMDKELSNYKDEIEASSYSVHELLTLASIIELEAGNASDRSLVAGVFYNRLNSKWTLGSDVTTYYALKIDDFSYSLSKKELATCNKYNTRGNCVTALPVGPISNPGIESIKATIEPSKTTDFYFVADCSGKTYTSKTETEHNNIIAKLKSENNWCQ